MGLNEVVYASCSAAFLTLIALIVLRGRVSGIGAAIICACALTAAWAAGMAVPNLLPQVATTLLDSMRLSAWLILAVTLVGFRDGRRQASKSLPLLLTIGFCIAAVGYELVMPLVDPIAAEASRSHQFLRIGFGVGGLIATENLLRNSDEPQRRQFWALCLVLGGMFSFELFLYADLLMARSFDSTLAAGRGLVGILAVPALAIAMARNREWRIDIHVSRTVVLHTATLVASGLFFLGLALVGVFVRGFGGSWGPMLQLLTLLGSAIVLASIFGSRDARIHLKQIIARHFFSHRFDYRAEWLRFVDTVSQPGTGEDCLSARIVRALAQIVDSPAGTLWCLRQGGGYAPEVGWNMHNATGQRLQSDTPFIAGFRGGEWIQERSSATQENWSINFADGWLAIPLSHANEMIAFVVLASPPHLSSPDWESFDLLRAAGRQAASYLAEERSTRALLDSQVLTDYSKRFAFVIHDIKNLASQLGMVVANARRYITDPEFQQDMLRTVEDSAARMNRLLAQLRVDNRLASGQLIKPDVIIASLAQEFSTAGIAVETRLSAPDAVVAIDGDQFCSVLFHLISNANDAGQSVRAVVVASRSVQNKLVIDIVDRGAGMDEKFVRDELFQPFRSTKAGGLGIGAYQTRELLRMAGADLDVISEKGVGTIMRITFPMHRDADVTYSAA